MSKVLSDVLAIEARIGIPATAWPGRCHEIAAACLKAKLVRGHLCYGHFLGGIAKTGHFAGRAFAHHGWIELRDGRIWDPTRWVFEDVAPYIYIGPADRYDFGGNRLNEVLGMRGEYPPTDLATERPVPLNLPARARRAIGAVIGQPDWDGRATPRQLHWLGNVNIFKLDPRICRALFREVIRLGHGASIPLDNYNRILR